MTTDPIRSTLEATGASNIAETLAAEMKKPEIFDSEIDAALKHLLLPPGWQYQAIDEEHVLDTPRQLRAKVALSDRESFVAYVRRHQPASGTDCRTIWCSADWTAGQLQFLALIDDHAPAQAHASWRKHVAAYAPATSVEWKRWHQQDRKAMSQVEFASFVEDNRTSIASVEGFPTSAQMFEMAINMEANQDVRFKSAIRLQNGGTQLQFIADDDKQTIERMQLFERFAIGIPVFWNGDAYQITARLKYRVRDGKVSFWYELERTDVVFEAAARELIAAVRAGAEVPFFFGAPGL